MFFYVLTKESRMTPGDQILLEGSFDKEKMDKEKKRRLEEDEKSIGFKLYYLYKVHEVKVI